MKRVDEERELTRLLAQEREALEPSIDVLRERGPDATELASLASRLMLQGLPLAPSVPPRASPTWKKWAAVGGGGTAAVLLWLAAAPSPGVPQSSERTEQSAPVAGPASSSKRVTPAPSNRSSPRLPAEPATAAIASLAGTEVVPAPADIPASPSTPAQRAAAVPDAPAPAASSERASSGVKTTALANPTASNAAPPMPNAAVGPSEIELLRDARLALRQNPSTALAITEQHGRLYPQGKLSQERELMAISALVALGRRTAALSRAARFERAFPSSPYRKQLGELLQ